MMIPHSRPTICEEDISCVVTNLRSGLLAYGEEVAQFERELSSYIGVLGGVATNSGTSALHLALEALGIKPGDEVVVPSYVCASVLHAVKCTGASPVLADIGLAGYNIAPKSVAKRITRNTKAVIVPHLFGIAADIDELLQLGPPIIEDCAQAIGAQYKRKKLGSYGILSTFSFKATKVMTTGHGGMVATNSKEILEKVRNLVKYDQLDEYHVSHNYLLTDFQAALGRSQLKRLGSFIERRREIARMYDDVFQDISQNTQEVGDGIIFRYVVDVDNADQYIKAMRKRGVYCARPVFKPLHEYIVAHGEFPNTERAMSRTVSIPIYPSLSDEEIRCVCRSVERVWSEQRKGR
jgi:perosamine synthetase